MAQAPELAGGTGFTFEDEVAATYLAALLCREEAPGLIGRAVTRVALQQRDAGDPLDDLVVDGRRADGSEARLSLQLKRALTISDAESNADFRDILHDSWRTLDKDDFREGVDQYGAATQYIATDKARDLTTLCELARASATPSDFAARFEPQGNASSGVRAILNDIRSIARALGRPDDLGAMHRFLSHFVLMAFDVLHAGATHTARVAAGLRHALRTDAADQAPLLHDRLRRLAREGAGRSAVWDRASLERDIAPYVPLRVDAPAPNGDLARSDGTTLWREVRFKSIRDLGPALMGRPLGPGDVAACPELPESGTLLQELERAGSARLVGVPGAGKSICLLQTAQAAHARGWRVVRLADSSRASAVLPDAAEPTLHLIDDAHLMPPALLQQLEECASPTSWVLSAHTTAGHQPALHGTVHLDAKRAVAEIARGLRRVPEQTLAAVRQADDRVGTSAGDEGLEIRLDAAAKAEFPWQFCFILGGGWRRARSMASSARAVGAELALSLAAIQQIASRDARCSFHQLKALATSAGLGEDIGTAVDWLVGQRLLLASDDLRCPHQRLATVLIDEILSGVDAHGRACFAAALHVILADPAMPLAGLAALMGELGRAGDFGRWAHLVDRAWLEPVLRRVWSASTPLDIRQACWVLDALHWYRSDETAELAAHRETLAGWLEAAPEGACYALGSVINHVHNKDEALGRAIVEEVDPARLAGAICSAGPLHASEIAHMISVMRVGQYTNWKTRYLAGIDRAACYRLVAAWPESAWMSAAADFCEHFAYFEPEFGFELVEGLLPAIAGRMRADPASAFHELNDIVWNALRLYDPLRIYVGKLAPTRRMLTVGRKLAACWEPFDLAAKLSATPKHSFQDAAGLLSFLRKASPARFARTIGAIDWDRVDATIGEDWATSIGDAEKLLGVAYGAPAERPRIEALIARNESRITTLSARLAAMAPETTFRHVSAGRPIGLTPWEHVEWQLGALIVAHFAEQHPELLEPLLAPHLSTIAAALSQQSPSFYNEGLLFLRLLGELLPQTLADVIGRIDLKRAETGWINAIRGLHNNGNLHGRAISRQVVAFLIERSLVRDDGIGDLSRRLRARFSAASTPSAKTLAPLGVTKPVPST